MAADGLMGKADRWARVEIQRDGAFDAGQYSFFGDLGGNSVPDTLAGALEDGLEAPPDEEGLLEAGLGDDALPEVHDEDLSLVSMLANQHIGGGHGNGEHAGTLDGSRPAAAKSVLDEDLDVQSARAAAMEQLRQRAQQQQQQQQIPQPAASLFNGAPQSHLHQQQQQQQHTPLPQRQQQQQQHPPNQGTPMHITKPMTAEELEAQMLGASAPAPSSLQPAQQQQQQQQQPGYMGPAHMQGLPHGFDGLQQQSPQRMQQQQPPMQMGGGPHMQQQHQQQHQQGPPGPFMNNMPPHMQQHQHMAHMMQQQQQPFPPGARPPMMMGGGMGGPHQPPPPGMMSPMMMGPPGGGPPRPMQGGPFPPGMGPMRPPHHMMMMMGGGSGMMTPPPHAMGMGMGGPPMMHTPPPPHHGLPPHHPSAAGPQSYSAMTRGPLPPGGGAPHGQAPPPPGMMMGGGGGGGGGPMQGPPGMQGGMTPPPGMMQGRGPFPMGMGRQPSPQQHSGSPMRGSPFPTGPQSGMSSGFGTSSGFSNAGGGHGGAGMHHGGGGGGGAMHLQRPRFNGEKMSEQEVEHIMHIMYTAVHMGPPYVEDYYYQAFINKHHPGALRNAAAFQPEALRGLTAQVAKLDPTASVKFVELDGLGKIVLSNIRTPKVLMDMSSIAQSSKASSNGAEAGAAAGGKEGPQQAAAATRPLEQEPLLAARILVEECHQLLLDVDDIDRKFAAAAGMVDGLPADAAGLRHRRALLAAGIAASFRIPRNPAGHADEDGGEVNLSDAVFMRIMELPKGRVFLARALRVLLSPPPAARGAQGTADSAGDNADSSGSGTPQLASNVAAPHHLLWALLRNAVALFGAAGLVRPDAATAAALSDATHQLASAARDSLHMLNSPVHIAGALEALVTGLQQHAASRDVADIMDRLLPLADVRPGGPGGAASSTGSSEWLGGIVVGLLQKGQQLGLRDSDDGMLAAQWQQHVGILAQLFADHVGALGALHAAAAAAGANAPPEALPALRALACRPLAQQLVPAVAEQATRDRLKEMLRLLL